MMLQDDEDGCRTFGSEPCSVLEPLVGCWTVQIVSRSSLKN
jgi:hypothetical protein